MGTKRITDIKTFASALKRMLGEAYPSCTVEIHEVSKNNGQMRTGILIWEKGRSIAPAIYLEELFGEYWNGKPLDEICRRIQRIHTESNPDESFDISSITDFSAVKNKICYRLVNAERNAALLREAPHRLWQDLAVVYYVALSKDSSVGISSFAVKNNLLEMWGMDEPALHELAKQNTPVLFEAEVTPISDVINSMLEEMQECGQIAALPDMEEPENLPPLYVATNECKCHGAAVLLYDGVLERFAERIGSDFYILPSSVHETLFMPVLPDTDGCMLPELVCGINTEQVSPEEVLSDNVYLYHAGDGSVTQIG